MTHLRIAILTHFYPPAQAGGAAVYAKNLALGLKASMIDVEVLCAGTWEQGDAYISGFRDEIDEGIPVRRIDLNWKKSDRPFDFLYDSPPIGHQIRQYLTDLKPDLVHIISTYSLSICAVTIPKAMGIRTIVHLMDMWFICPRHTFLKKDGTICHGSRGAWDCQSCMLWDTKLHRALHPVLGEKRFGSMFNIVSRIDLFTRMPGLIGMLGDMNKRKRKTWNGLLDADAVVAPSDTITKIYIENGYPMHKIRKIRHGYDPEWSERIKHVPSKILRIGFLGNVSYPKGVHVLIEAFNKIKRKESIHLHIYGHVEEDSDYAASLLMHDNSDTTWHGAYQHSQLPLILSHLDVTIFPSIWSENSPLVIRESLAGGCPVICSDVSGATEWITDGVNGFHFKVGDADQLASRLEYLIENRGVIEKLRSNIEPNRRFQDELNDIVDLYRTFVLNN